MEINKGGKEKFGEKKPGSILTVSFQYLEYDY